MGISAEQHLYRIYDPQTSRDAADKSESFTAKHEARIFGAIFDAGEKGATYREIAAATGMEPVAVARRLKGMERRGVIERRHHFGQLVARDGMAVWFKA